MEIKNIRVKDLKPYKNNPRINDNAVPAVAASIKEFGFKVPIVIDTKYVIVCGHTRYKAALQLGLETVPCVVADDLSEKQIKAFRLADNKVGELATWDMDLLNAELEDLPDIDMSDFGFELETEDILEEGEEDEYNLDEGLEQELRVHRGEIWRLGKHRLMCGDSTTAKDVAKLMDGELADMVLTDPPYNVNYGDANKMRKKVDASRKDRTIMNDNMDDDLFHEFLFKAFANMNVAIKDGGAFYVWYASREVINFSRALAEAGLTVKQELIWAKNAIVLGRQDYQWKHEPCLYGWKEGAAHYFIDDRTQSTVIEDEHPEFKKMHKDELVALLEDVFSDKVSTTVIHEDKPARSELHPTMKPIKLMARMIKNSSKQGELVLDLFGGSGSTLIAAEQLNRRCNIMEFDEKYATVIVDRWEKLTDETAVRL